MRSTDLPESIRLTIPYAYGDGGLVFYTFPVLTKKDALFEERERLNPARTLKEIRANVEKLCFIVQDIEGWDDFESRQGKITPNENTVEWTESESAFQQRALTFYREGSEFRQQLMETHAKHALEARERVIYPAPVFCRLSSGELSGASPSTEAGEGTAQVAALSAVQAAE